MRPELARSYQEVGLRLVDDPVEAQRIDGRSASAYLDEARGIFDELGLHWDLARLEGGTPP